MTIALRRSTAGRFNHTTEHPVLFFLSEKSCQFVTHVLHRLTKLPAVKMGNLEFDGGDFKTGGKTRTNLVCRPAGYSKFETDCLLVVKFVAMVNLSLFHFPSANWLQMLSRHARCYWARKKKKLFQFCTTVGCGV